MRSFAVRVAAAAAMTAGAIACADAPPKAPPPAPEVYVARVTQRTIPVYVDLVGETRGVQDVDIRARVEGFLESMQFREGSFVRKGTVLYQIDRKPFEAALAGARADLATARARLEKTTTDVARFTPLVAKQAVSQLELDNAHSARDAARSQVDAAGAAVDLAALQLGYTRVTAPIDGLVGTTLVKPGNLVGRGEPTLLTTISQIDPIMFVVGLTEADYLRIATHSGGRPGAPPRTAGIELTLADGAVYPYMGRVGAVERAVNTSTGTLGAQLLFPNPTLVLRPGAYGRARVLIDTMPDAMVVPQRAVQEQQGQYSAAVVGADKKIEFRTLKVGPKIDAQWVILDGLAPGEQVVADGVQAIRDAMLVRPRMSDAPAPVATGGTAPEGR